MESNHHLSLTLTLLYAGFKRVESWWNYQHVVSPFYRLYYIQEGEGTIYMNQTSYRLSPGQLFLIPKFVVHSYACNDYMEHYYICFFDDIAGKSGINNPLLMKFQVQAQAIDYALIHRYIQLNPGKNILICDPKQYDNDRSLYEKQSSVNFSRFPYDIESKGILLQLFSRFLTEACMKEPHQNSLHEKLNQVIHYINKNLDKRIQVSDLADILCVTPDHCSKTFKKIIGISPCEYIQVKRIERAQTLLLTTNKPVSQIAEEVGIGNLSQFSRLFSKISHCSAREYRNIQIKQLESGDIIQ